MEPIETLELRRLSFTLNGQAWSGGVPVEEVLLDLLRERVRLTGTKHSCEWQVCGACTVLVDGRPASSCSYPAFEADGRSVTTVEDLADGSDLDPLQEAFVRNVGFQCGYCTPGQLMAATGLLVENSAPSYEEIAEWMKGNICRCGSYTAIARSVLEAAEAAQAGAAKGAGTPSSWESAAILRASLG